MVTPDQTDANAVLASVAGIAKIRAYIALRKKTYFRYTYLPYAALFRGAESGLPLTHVVSL